MRFTIKINLFLTSETFLVIEVEQNCVIFMYENYLLRNRRLLIINFSEKSVIWLKSRNNKTTTVSSNEHFIQGGTSSHSALSQHQVLAGWQHLALDFSLKYPCIIKRKLPRSDRWQLQMLKIFDLRDFINLFWYNREK